MPNEWVNMKRLKSNFAGRMGPNFLVLSVVTRLSGFFPEHATLQIDPF